MNTGEVKGKKADRLTRFVRLGTVLLEDEEFITDFTHDIKNCRLLLLY